MAKGKGQTVNRSGLAEIFGAALPTIDSWIRQGLPCIQKGGRGKEWQFDTAAVAAWREQRRVEEATGDAPADEKEMKRREVRAKTLLVELDLAKAMGEVATIKDFQRAQAAAFAQIRANVMNVSQRIVVQLLGETDETVFKAKLNAELTLALQAAREAELVIDEDSEAGDDE